MSEEVDSQNAVESGLLSKLGDPHGVLESLLFSANFQPQFHGQAAVSDQRCSVDSEKVNVASGGPPARPPFLPEMVAEKGSSRSRVDQGPYRVSIYPSVDDGEVALSGIIDLYDTNRFWGPQKHWRAPQAFPGSS